MTLARSAVDAPPARLAGLFYLFVILGGSASLVIGMPFVAPGDAAATSERMRNAEELYRLGLVSNLFATFAYVGVIGVFAELFRPVSRSLSTTAALFGLAGCAVSGAAAFDAFGAMLLAEGGAHLSPFSRGELDALAYEALRRGGPASSVSLSFFGCYCLAIGGLIFTSRFLPRWLGVGMMIAGASWLAANLSLLLAPAFGRSISAPLMATSILGETALTLWLLVAGVDRRRWRDRFAAWANSPDKTQ
jgi:hypothetical protein